MSTAASLPYGSHPQDCIEFDINAYNDVGRGLAEAIAQLFDDRWVIFFTPLECRRPVYLSRLMDRFRPIGLAAERSLGDRTPILDWSKRPSDDLIFPQKWVRAGVFSWLGGVFDVTGTESCCASLPLDPELADELDETFLLLCKRWTEIEEEAEGETVPNRSYENARGLIAAEGLRAALRLKSALPDDWTVVYFDIEQAER